MSEARRMARARNRLRRRANGPLKVVVPTAAALGAGAAIAVGSIPGPNGTITGCYQTIPSNAETGPGTPYGTLRLIDPSKAGTGVPQDEYQCFAGTEQQITWNQQGPPGPTGPQGPTGPAGATGPAGMTVTASSGPGLEIFMKVDGIDGEATTKGYEKDIALDKFSLGFTQSGSGHVGSGAGAGKVNVESFTFAKAVDSSSPKLLLDLVSGKHIKAVTVDIVKPVADKFQKIAEYKMTDVLVSSFHQTASNKATEVGAGDFAKIEYAGYNSKTGGSAGKTGWDSTSHKVTAASFKRSRRH